MAAAETQARWRWLLNRLRCMSPAEVLYRGGVAIRGRLRRRLGLDRLVGRPTDTREGGACWLAVPAAFDAAPVVAEALAIADGSVRLFAQRSFEVGALPDWNRCPLNGVACPPLPSHEIDIGDSSRVGDIKHLWELNRHLQWVTLAQAWALTQERRHLDALARQLAGWLEQCPPGRGPNWTSSLEYALRLLNWSLVWQLIGGAASPMFDGVEGRQLRERWLASINVHVRATAQNYSRHSSANNHLLGELAGVFVASRVWPFWPDVRRLGARARAELEREAQLQVAPDGVLREQAFEYATFVFDLLLIVDLAAAAGGAAPMSGAYRARMLALCAFIGALRTASGAVPMVGDADGAEAWRLDSRPGRDPFDSMLRKGAWLTGRGAIDWLAPRAPLAAALPPAGPDFPQGGYQRFGSDAGGPREVLGLIDTGPLGYLGIAAHGHADALQVWLALGGAPLLVDPGTYGYGVPAEWREYFRGTSAHNTVCIGGESQSVSGGPFMWLRKANCTLLEQQRDAGGGLRLRAAHDGYRRLQGFEHERSLAFDPAAATLLVDDRVHGTGQQRIELHWHLAPDWHLDGFDAEGRTLGLSRAGVRVRIGIEADVPGRLSLHRGEENPPLGWYSSAYRQKQATTVLRWQGRAAAARLATRIEWRFDAAPRAH